MEPKEIWYNIEEGNNIWYSLIGELIEKMGNKYWKNSYLPHKLKTEGR